MLPNWRDKDIKLKVALCLPIVGNKKPSCR